MGAKASSASASGGSGGPAATGQSGTASGGQDGRSTATAGASSGAAMSAMDYRRTLAALRPQSSTSSSGSDMAGVPNRGPFILPGIKCPVCNKFVLPDDIECHLVMCLTKPRLSYNEDVLTDAKGECVICLEDLNCGDVIARLPCLCVYHKTCIDRWFEVNRCCPEHPGE